MHYPPPDLLPAVERAAELRAAGFAWKSVAEELDRPWKTVEKWPRLYPDFWADRLAAARAELRDGAADEAVAVLRNLLRSDDEKIQRDASRDLLDRAAPKAEAEPPKRSDLHRLADFLEGLSDDDRRTLLGDDLPDDAPRPAVQAAPEHDPPGPD
ncbi:MAG TPA: hypothetical protein VM597_38035 [Gemmataceae bacterium]|nr:hypothetical protein [Gemmataceae bacterium]